MSRQFKPDPSSRVEERFQEKNNGSDMRIWVTFGNMWSFKSQKDAQNMWVTLSKKMSLEDIIKCLEKGFEGKVIWR